MMAKSFSPIQLLMQQDLVLACALTPKFYGGPQKQPYLRRAVPLYIAERTGLSRHAVERAIMGLLAVGQDWRFSGPDPVVRVREVRHGWHYYRVVERVIQ